MNRAVVTSTLLAALMCAATTARADTITVSSAGIDPYANQTLNISVNGGGWEDVYAGQILLTTTGGVLPVFCTDIYHNLTSGTSFTSVGLSVTGGGATLSSGQVAQIGSLISNFDSYVTFDHSTTPYDTWTSVAPSGFGSINQFAAVTQVAIWSVENGANFNFQPTAGITSALVTGLIGSADPNFQTTPQEYVPSTSSGGPLGNCGSLTDSTCWNNQAQSFIGSNLGNTHSDTPEPASMALLGAGLVGLGALRRKSRRA